MIGAKLDRTGFVQTFADEFNGPSHSPPDPSVWTTKYYFSPPDKYPNGSTPSMLAQYAGRTIPGGIEDEVYVDFQYGKQTMTQQMNGLAIITAEKMAPAEMMTLGQERVHYKSGLITTQHYFDQVLGYFESKMLLPKVPGTWPAFWMLPTKKTLANAGNRPEFDIMEHWAGQMTVMSQGKPFIIDRTGKPISTLHTKVNGIDTAIGNGSTAAAVDLTLWHTYGLKWTTTELIWYVDDHETFRTPCVNFDPHYLLINLAVDSRYNPPGGFAYAQLMVDWVRAWKIPT